MNKIREVFRLKLKQRRSYREIAHSLNIGVATALDYIKRGRTAGLSWPLPDGMSDQKLYEILFPSEKHKRLNRPLPDWEWVHQELRKKGVTRQLLWREYKDQHPDGMGYANFCIQYQTYKNSITPVMRQTHEAGKTIFVDYAGMKMTWIDPATHDKHDAEIFVGSLGASQYTFIEATATQQIPDWLMSHEHMFEYFNGVSEIITPDNLKSAVTKAHIYDPDINQTYQHFAEYYGVAVVPARAKKPKDKAKVENAVGCIEKQVLAPLRHKMFFSLGEINESLRSGLEIFNTQNFQKMKTSRRILFEEIDKPALHPLPLTRYEFAEWKKAKIQNDYHFRFDDHDYSVPYQYIQQDVEVRATAKIVECFYQRERIAAHERSYKKYHHTTVLAHMPIRHRVQTENKLEHIKNQALQIGYNTTNYINLVIASRAFPEQAHRTCIGILRLEKRFGKERLEQACTKGLLTGDTRYDHIESILKNHLENVPIEKTTDPPCTVHSNVRGANYYQ